MTRVPKPKLPRNSGELHIDQEQNLICPKNFYLDKTFGIYSCKPITRVRPLNPMVEAGREPDYMIRPKIADASPWVTKDV